MLSGPSGVGKSTLAQAVLDQDEHLARAITHTSRAARESERNGVHYHFVSESQFLAMMRRDEFLETVHIFGNYYGTSRKAVLDSLANGTDTLLIIDWQGAQSVRQQFQGVTSLFVLPPSVAALNHRLTGRETEEHASYESRLASARDEMSHYNEYDYVLINDLFDTTVEQIHEVVETTRANRNIQIGPTQAAIEALLAST